MRFGPAVGALAAAILIFGPAGAADRVLAELKTIAISASSKAEPATGSRGSFYPAPARKAGAEGSAVLRCAAQRGGRFADCHVLEENPKDQGFGPAAITAAAKVVQPIPDGHGGVATDGDAILPFVFLIEERQRQLLPPQRVAWERMPQGVDMARIYPEAAQHLGREGYALIECGVGPTGQLTDCLGLTEAPYGWGFKEAALALGPMFKMKTVLKDGGPIPMGGKVRIPIIFRLPKG